jgi:hypothetical protein
MNLRKVGNERKQGLENAQLYIDALSHDFCHHQ